MVQTIASAPLPAKKETFVEYYANSFYSLYFVLFLNSNVSNSNKERQI